jgi:hypothetical protein
LQGLLAPTISKEYLHIVELLASKDADLNRKAKVIQNEVI